MQSPINYDRMRKNMKRQLLSIFTIEDLNGILSTPNYCRNKKKLCSRLSNWIALNISSLNDPFMARSFHETSKYLREVYEIMVREIMGKDPFKRMNDKNDEYLFNYLTTPELHKQTRDWVEGERERFTDWVSTILDGRFKSMQSGGDRGVILTPQQWSEAINQTFGIVQNVFGYYKEFPMLIEKNSQVIRKYWTELCKKQKKCKQPCKRGVLWSCKFEGRRTEEELARVAEEHINQNKLKMEENIKQGRLNRNREKYNMELYLRYYETMKSDPYVSPYV